MKVLSMLLIIILSSILYGCVTATIVGTAAISTKIIADPRTIGTQIDDSVLKLRINRVLLKDKQIKNNAKISTIVYYGKVLLIGQSQNIKLISRAKYIAMKVAGTTKIYNEVRQSVPINIKTSLLDTWITTKIYTYLLKSDQVRLSNIKVITENGEVFLLGLTTEFEGQIAADIASRTSGVKHVTTIFSYIG